MRILRQIHASILTRGLPISTLSFTLSKIIAFCALSTHGDVFYAERVLSQAPKPNIFSWNYLIRGFSQSQKFPWSICIFKSLIAKGYPKPDTFTFAFVLKACSLLPAFREGQQVHSWLMRSGHSSSPFVRSSLINFYAKCEVVECARKVFDEIPERNVVSWSAMIGGYARVDMFNEALDMFRDMQMAGLVPDAVTMASVVSACAGLGALDVGRWLHAYIDKQRIVKDLELSTALINMYAKCGSVENAKEVFDAMPIKDSKAWSSMIIGFAIHGQAEDALNVFEHMKGIQAKPNSMAFLGVLLACAHGQLVAEGRTYWSGMEKFGIEPSMEHYSCMVDLLCRANLVEEAYTFIQNMPVCADPVIWRTLLVACKRNKDMEKGEVAGQRLLELEPSNPENYALLSSFYATCSEWANMCYMRKQMRDKAIKPTPACSSIEVDGTVHEFVLGDWSHPETNGLREVLRNISSRLESSGYKPNISVVLHDVGDEVKEEALCEHSERLAIAYGILKTKAPAVIRVVKNLRVCDDCHEVTKIISRLYGREIVVRDRVRFHRFVNGACSCRDLW